MESVHNLSVQLSVWGLLGLILSIPMVLMGLSGMLGTIFFIRHGGYGYYGERISRVESRYQFSLAVNYLLVATIILLLVF